MFVPCLTATTQAAGLAESARIPDLGAHAQPLASPVSAQCAGETWFVAPTTTRTAAAWIPASAAGVAAWLARGVRRRGTAASWWQRGCGTLVTRWAAKKSGKRKQAKKSIGSSAASVKKEEEEEELEFVVLPEDGMTVGELAKLLKQTPASIITYFFVNKKLPIKINDSLEKDACEEVAAHFDIEVLVEEPESKAADRGFLTEKHDDAEPRPPVITVMGHVDHGKTTLLDTIRQRSVAASESGGITQRIGAYTIEVNGGRITFIDTPGHEAFTSMRARGAQVTDVAILVVAADDGVMPQTREAIAHIKAAQVPMIVAINKIDVPKADPMMAKQKLGEEGVYVEDFGGEVPVVEISAKKNINIDSLLELINITAEVEELKALRTGPAAGVVLETTGDPKKGILSTLLVQKGQLKVGDTIVSGSKVGKVRYMVNEAGTQQKEAGPSTAVQMSGFPKPPESGDQFQVYEDAKEANKVAAAAAKKETKANVGFLGLSSSTGDKSVSLALILKTDAQGSIDAVKHMFSSVRDSKYVNLKWVLTGVGGITESDVELAAACPEGQRAMCIGFNSPVLPKAASLAKRKDVEVRTFKVIYELFETIVAALENSLGKEDQYLEKGRAEVLAVFGGVGGKVAGCRVEDGMLSVGNVVKVYRGGSVVGEAPIMSLRQGKSSVDSVDEGNECGFILKDFEDWEKGDQIMCFEVTKSQVALFGKK